MTTDQEENWAEDPNVYVADEEDDIFSVRTSGELVLEEVLRQADGAAGMLAGAVRRRLDEAAAAQVHHHTAAPCSLMPKCCAWSRIDIQQLPSWSVQSTRRIQMSTMTGKSSDDLATSQCAENCSSAMRLPRPRLQK